MRQGNARVWAGALAIVGLGGASTGARAVVVRQVTVERVGEGVISTGRNETFPVEDPMDGSLWFSVYDQSFDQQTIMRAARGDGTWVTPETAPFSGRWGDRAPRFSPDGDRLYFTSNRPMRGSAPGDMNVWMTERRRDGWSEPVPLPAPVNGEARDMHVAATASALYFASNRPGGAGLSDVYRVAGDPVGGGSADRPAGRVNDAHSQPDLWVSPDESWMILVVTDHPEGLGGDDLFVLRRTADGWSAPRHLAAPINTDEYEYGPSISADGEWLYFTSHRGGSGDIYRVRLRAAGLPPGR
ncbi:MAG: hypothetical protein PVH00_03170 [Gemmatimonadota bacterium]|jgi:hypothetical protein